MFEDRRLTALAALLALAVVGCFLLQVRGAAQSADRVVGVLFDQETDGRIWVTGVRPGGPAHAGGFVTGDTLLAIEGVAIRFFAVFRYHLFDLELVVRRSLLYSLLTTTLLLVFYATLGAGGALLLELIGDGRRPVWVFSAATLVLGLLFAPLRGRLQQLIDRRLIPERRSLRRESILDLLEKEVERAIRYKRQLAIAFADLDDLKRVNDELGHLAGDEVLKAVAATLELGLRSTDANGRYGGDEFLMLFPETDLEAAEVLAEKMLARVDGLRVPIDGGREVSVRLSLGLASLADLGFLDDGGGGPRAVSRRGASVSRALIDAADKALYRAKEERKRRIESGSRKQRAMRSRWGIS